MAIGRRLAADRFPQGDGFTPFNHYVYGVVGDGCLMEGISAEAASMAGHLGLGEMIFFYDDNGITIEGSTEIAFTEDVAKRFEAYGWHTLRIDGHNQTEIKQAIATAKADKRPSLIIAKTHIGYGSPNRQDTEGVHGAPLGEEEAKLTKEKLGWTYGPFEVPEQVRALFKAHADKGRAAHAAWKSGLDAWLAKDTERKAKWVAHFEGRVELNIDALVEELKDMTGGTRGMSGKALNAIAKQTPRVLGGSADLAHSNKSDLKGEKSVQANDFSGRNFHYGVREHAMGAVVNGLALYGGFIPYGATFLVFSDYVRPSLRLSALMKIRSLEIFTHDSIGLGEDGPTHQAVEHLWSLRLIPDYTVWRPADGVETAMAWAYAIAEGEDAPHGLVFSRQGVQKLERPESFRPTDVWKGAYVVSGSANAKAVIAATGTEVDIAVGAAKVLGERGIEARVVSIPSYERFVAQGPAYEAELFPAGALRAVVEAGRTGPWRALIGSDGLGFGVDTFGVSAPYKTVYDHFGLTPEKIADAIAAKLS